MAIATFESKATETKAVVQAMANGFLSVQVFCTRTNLKSYAIGFSPDREADAIAFARRITNQDIQHTEIEGQDMREGTLHITTVDQHTGNHTSGARMTRLTEVRTDLSDYVPTDDFDAMPADQQAETLDVLADIHNARVELASLDADHRARAEEWIAVNSWTNDFDAVPHVIRKAIRETESD